MKKLIILVLILILTTFTGCGRPEEEPVPAKVEDDVYKINITMHTADIALQIENELLKVSLETMRTNYENLLNSFSAQEASRINNLNTMQSEIEAKQERLTRIENALLLIYNRDDPTVSGNLTSDEQKIFYGAWDLWYKTLGYE